MLRFLTAFVAIVLTASLLALAGCQKSSQPAAGSKSAAPEAADQSAQDLPDGLKELSAADRAEALKQRACPVSGQPLGSMGKPIKLTVKGRAVWICCESCQEDLEKNPDKFLAKLNNGGK